MSNAETNESEFDRYPWRVLFTDSVVGQLNALRDAAKDIAAMRSRERLRCLRQAQEHEAAVSTDYVLELLASRLDQDGRGGQPLPLHPPTHRRIRQRPAWFDREILRTLVQDTGGRDSSAHE